MPNCFTLTRIGETEPTPLMKIDEELCALTGRDVDPNHWVHGWMDSVGMALACGKDWAWLRAEYARGDYFPRHAEATLKIVAYLEANFTTDAWAEIGRH